MSQAAFQSLYATVRDLKPNKEILKKIVEEELTEKLTNALKEAEKVIANQADSLLVTSSEFVKLCALNRMLLRKATPKNFRTYQKVTRMQ